MATDNGTRKNGDHQVIPTEKKLDELYGLIEGIEVAMLTTHAADGSLVSRPMATQALRRGTDLWFMTNVETQKVDELVADPRVNLAYYKSGSREFVSVSGMAHVTQDKAAIHELYQPDWRAWLGDEGGARDGGPNDPRIALIEVQAQSAVYLKLDRPRPLVLFSLLKGIVTGDRAEVGDVERLDRGELARGPSHEK